MKIKPIESLVPIKNSTTCTGTDFTTCTAIDSCTNTAIYVSLTDLLCESCYTSFKTYGYSPGMRWSDFKGNEKYRINARDGFDIAITLLSVNIDLYRYLPEKLKSLAIPMKAFLYCSTILKGPSDLLLPTIETEFNLGLRYSEISHSRVEYIEKELLTNYKKVLWDPHSRENSVLLDYICSLVRNNTQWDKGRYKKTPNTYFKEGETALIHSPSNIVKLSSVYKARIVRSENTLFHNFSATRDYLEYTLPDGERLLKYEKFINNMYKKFFNVKDQKLDKESIKRYCKVKSSYVSLLMNSLISGSGDLKKDLNMVAGIIEKEEKDEANMNFQNRIIFGRGKSFHDSVYFEGSPSLVSYAVNRRKSRWKEAEPFMAKEVDTNIISYIKLFVNESCDILEQGIVRDSNISSLYIMSGIKVKNFSNFEKLLFKEIKNKVVTPEDGLYTTKNLDTSHMDVYTDLCSLYGCGKVDCLHEETLKLVASSPDLTMHYVKSTGKRLPEGEVSILNSPPHKTRYIELLKRIRDEKN
jgi:hypothetical protein